jgi:Na+/H+-dicarboxylate symporter
MSSWIKNYSGMIWLITGIIAGSIAGILFGKKAEIIKPIGDIFLNLLFVAVIPLVFFAISSAIANLQGAKKLSRIMGIMVAVFIGTVIVAALITMAAVWLFPIKQAIGTAGVLPESGKKLSGDEITQLFTTSEFFQ